MVLPLLLGFRLTCITIRRYFKALARSGSVDSDTTFCFVVFVCLNFTHGGLFDGTWIEDGDGRKGDRISATGISVMDD
ncbi:Protein of unknown function [Pyronema omphalodes CBS 100304]|uniref:Uncharacterized protein n=1 Tax=Pyronema omphalodes (strain CBS 100304) TaxID=1076935 RepID=U4KYR7_PYROM|nr:Protein of unknown function [Pyronema omphalodes CBS 100304]